MRLDTLIAPAENGIIPDAAIRWGIRRLLARRLARERAGGFEAQPDALHAFLSRLRESPIAIETDAANAQHYALPPSFFQLMLGRRLKYSACLWPEGVTDLDAAEEAMLELTGARAGLADGMDILELGCGWGSLTLWMAERYPTSRILAVSNSRPQRACIEAACTARGLANVTVRTADMNAFNPGRRFDRIVSVEMFEHMRNWERLFGRLRDWLCADGRAFVHVFCHREYAYCFEPEAADDWMARFFFSGGIMPAEMLPYTLQRDLLVERHWRVNGRHYTRTLHAWLERLDARRAEAMPILRETYGAAQARVWWNRWRLFLLACAELFDYRAGREWYVGHYRLAPR
jgi:cyclopropane-fatty-acyl-phospholipid synthase